MANPHQTPVDSEATHVATATNIRNRRRGTRALVPVLAMLALAACGRTAPTGSQAADALTDTDASATATTTSSELVEAGLITPTPEIQRPRSDDPQELADFYNYTLAQAVLTNNRERRNEILAQITAEGTNGRQNFIHYADEANRRIRGFYDPESQVAMGGDIMPGQTNFIPGQGGTIVIDSFTSTSGNPVSATWALQVAPFPNPDGGMDYLVTDSDSANEEEIPLFE